MRIVIVGASALAVATAKLLLKDHHDVVIIERDKAKIESLSESLDCGFLLGDGSRPAILQEAAPTGTDVLFCLTNHDQDNILASLVARSLGFQRVVTKIEDPAFEHICAELGLTDTIIPDLNTARTLADMVTGKTSAELSAAVRGEIRFFSFVAQDVDQGTVGKVDLPHLRNALSRIPQSRLPGDVKAAAAAKAATKVVRPVIRRSRAGIAPGRPRSPKGLRLC